MNNRVIDTIRQTMDEQAVSMYRLAQMSGLSQASVRLILNGENSPTLDSLDKICNALGLELKAKKIMKVNVYNGSELDMTIETEFADERGIDLLNFVAKSLNFAVYRVEYGTPVVRIRNEKRSLYMPKHNKDYFVQTRSNTTYILRDSNCLVLDLLRDKGAFFQRDFLDKFQKEFTLFGKTYKLVNDNE